MANYGCTCGSSTPCGCQNGTGGTVAGIAGDSTVSCPLCQLCGSGVLGSTDSSGIGCGFASRELLILIAIVLLLIVLLWGTT